MEPSTLFAEFVLGMCAVHLVRNASESIAKWWAKNHPGYRTATQQSAKKIVRSDWYVFFSYSDLVGKNPLKKQDPIRKSANPEKNKRNRRNVARV